MQGHHRPRTLFQFFLFRQKRGFPFFWADLWYPTPRPKPPNRAFFCTAQGHHRTLEGGCTWFRRFLKNLIGLPLSVRHFWSPCMSLKKHSENLPWCSPCPGSNWSNKLSLCLYLDQTPIPFQLTTQACVELSPIVHGFKWYYFLPQSIHDVEERLSERWRGKKKNISRFVCALWKLMSWVVSGSI